MEFCRKLIVAGIPAYNEEKNIAKVIVQATKYVDKVIVVDDGSIDLTAEIAEKLGATVIRHPVNIGYGAAIKSVFKTARNMGAGILVTIDADSQHDPKEIPKLIQPIANSDSDIVIGSRFIGGEGIRAIPAYRRYGMKVLNKLTGAVSKSRVSDTQSGFRAYSRKAIENLEIYEDGMGIGSEIIIKARTRNLRIAEVPITCLYGGIETSTQNPLAHAANVIISVISVTAEKRPILFFGLPGTIALLVGVYFWLQLLNLYVTLHYFVVSVALIAATTTLLGIFFIFTAIILYAIANLMRKIKE